MTLRKIWIICGWIVVIAGIMLIVAMGLALVGGAALSKMLPAMIMGGFFVISGWNFIVRGKQMPLSAVDHVRGRQMIMQAIRIGSLIFLGVAFMVGLLIFLRHIL